MKRWLIRILLCLILGAITTVAVAWGFALRSPLNGQWGMQEEPISVEEIPNAFGYGTDFDAFGGGASVRYRIGVTAWNVRYGSGRSFHDVYVEVGFPAAALAGLLQTIDFKHVRLIGLTSIAIPWVGDRTVPIEVLWPGFLINTLFYAAIWGGVWLGFVGGKRLIRSKRGRCPRCGYDLRGNTGLAAGCSECGWNRLGA